MIEKDDHVRFVGSRQVRICEKILVEKVHFWDSLCPSIRMIYVSSGNLLCFECAASSSASKVDSALFR
ncbi:hypothetical protein RchiOBHm_Chr3g0465541 [Rosa chinensis]|uniref:Uncharacterized protein n=1 Tax=Rosa chinensis TaxID=74649 RepID=A0A2P6R9Q7_ROSCH|nr:hypothetical protein RchiOBHm_Chr3g0465541 [Rosa chinensis]